MVSGVVMMVVALGGLDIDISGASGGYWVTMFAISLLVTGFFVIGIGLILGPVDKASLSDFYHEEKRPFDVWETKASKNVRADAPYWRQHVRVGTVVVFCDRCGHANLPEDETCSACDLPLME